MIIHRDGIRIRAPDASKIQITVGKKWNVSKSIPGIYSII